jgi:N-acetylmuramoyl-L-alanine amidase
MQNKSTSRAMAAKLQSDRMTVYLTRDSDLVGVNTF